MNWNPTQWPKSALVGAVAGISVTLSMLVTSGQSIGASVAYAIDVQPFALKAEVYTRLAQASIEKNLDRIDLLDFQITSLKNQLVQVRRVLADAPGDVSLDQQVKDVEKSIEIKSKEHELLKCLMVKRVTCVQ